MLSTIRQSMLLALLMLSVFNFTSIATAAEPPATRISSLAMAKKIIDDYKNLRSECAKAKDEKHRECVGRLNTATQDYRAAKKIISYGLAPMEQSTFAWQKTSTFKSN